MKKKSDLQKQIDKAVALAIKICITKNPKCELCNQPAITAHHFIHQARSNYLRCDQKNLVPICGSCHGSIHLGNNESLVALKLRKMRGSKWNDYILAGTQKGIKSDMFYWKKMEIILQNELKELNINK